MKNIVCFGEVLWDVFPTHKKIGGAPLNVALRLQSFNNSVSIITRIGDDKKGKQIAEFITNSGVNTNNIQCDPELETGAVNVVLDENGSASYTINANRAWDNIQLTGAAIKAVKTADAFVYGSLVARDETSRNTLYELLKVANYKILDINLRAPHYTIPVLIHLMKAANFIKFNDDEIIEISKALGCESETLEDIVLFLAEYTKTKSICVTRGEKGAMYYHDNKFYYNSGYKIDVVDTVGAGDSFLGSFINRLLEGVAAQDALNYASAIGALVASHKGANPNIKEKEIQELMQ